MHTIGTFWYHGHHHEQQIDGLVGAIIVHPLPWSTSNGRALADKYTLQISDYYNRPALSYMPQFISPESGGDEPVPDHYAVNNLLNNNLAVPWFVVNVAQRVAFNADLKRLVGLAGQQSVFIRVSGMPAMYPTYDPAAAGQGVFSTDTGLPLNFDWKGVLKLTKTAPSVPAYVDAPFLPIAPPLDDNLLQAKNVVNTYMPPATKSIVYSIDFYADEQGVNRPHVNFETYSGVLNTVPPLLYKYLSREGGPYMDTATAIVDGVEVVAGNANVPFVVATGEVVDVLFINHDGGEHPLHFHGQNYWVIASSAFPEAEALYAGAYLMRDTVSVPADGWVKIRFLANNPGIHLLHCHIDWHVAAGFTTAVVVGPYDLQAAYIAGQTVVPDSMKAACVWGQNQLNLGNTLSVGGAEADTTVSGSNAFPVAMVAVAALCSALLLLAAVAVCVSRCRATAVAGASSEKETAQTGEKSVDLEMPRVCIDKSSVDV